MTQVPALRAALQEAAERRYGRRRRVLRGVRFAVAMAATAAIVAFAFARPGSPPPADERRATPTPTPIAPHTVKVTPLPSATPSGPMEIIKPVLGGPDEDPGVSGKVERVWKTPGLGEHVFLTRKGTDWCLSVQDGDLPGDRGVGCSNDSLFRRLGVSLTVGDDYAAVIGPGRDAPTFRDADGKRRTLKVADGGLVAIANVPTGSAVVLHKQGGGRRTDAFDNEDPRFGPGHEQVECSDGSMLLAPVDRDRTVDPCARR